MDAVPARGFGVTVDFDDGGGATVALSGDLDRISAPAAVVELWRLLDRGVSPIVVDLADLAFVDLGGYRMLAEFGRACRTAGIPNLWRSPSSATRLLVRILGPLPGMLLYDPIAQIGSIDGHAPADSEVSSPARRRHTT
jgi:ABC-type transporter Mla MlaB component